MIWNKILRDEAIDLIGFQQRSVAALCHRWVRTEFLIVSEPSKKTRRYRLADELEF